jgi:SAM-dependent methyltransferase
MSSRIPERLRWAVDVLAVKSDERILEIGCGRGAAVELICERLEDGSITGIDRSPVAVAAAGTRNRAHLKTGSARFLSAALADAELDEQFDKVFAVNVNVFWLGPAEELAVILRVLPPGGQLYLFYEPPSAEKLDQISEACIVFLEREGFTVDEVLGADLGPALGLSILARPSQGTKLWANENIPIY